MFENDDIDLYQEENNPTNQINTKHQKVLTPMPLLKNY
jgi:hypothetical protein